MALISGHFFFSIPFSLLYDKVCCDGLLYPKKPQYHCCEGTYQSWNSSSNPVCCKGKLLPTLPDHQCCGGYYILVKNRKYQIEYLSIYNGSPFGIQFLLHVLSYVFVFVDEYCCPDHLQGRVSVGLGDSCCGGVPYSVKGGQLCCNGSLHDGYGVQCCGGKVVDHSLVCCGDHDEGEVHTFIPSEWNKALNFKIEGLCFHANTNSNWRILC